MSFKTSEADLRDAFGKFGAVTDVYIANDRETGRPRGFAFVTFATEEEAKAAAEKMNGVDLDGRQLTVNEAKPKTEMGGSGGPGGRNYGSPNRSPGAFQARGNSRY
jgi:cold-inducible RNA-binding protein